MILSLFELLLCVQIVIQLSQCPEPLIQEYLLATHCLHHIPFAMLVPVIVGALVMGIVLSSLVLKRAYFIVCLVMFAIMAPVLVITVVSPVKIRQRMMKKAIAKD